MAKLTMLVLLVASAAAAMAISDEEMEGIIHGLALQCEEVYPITEDDAELLHQHLPPKSPIGVCFLTCMFEKLGMMESGVFKAEQAKATVQKYASDDPDVLNKMGELLDICDVEVGGGDEKCGAGLELFKCFKTHAERVGFMPDA